MIEAQTKEWPILFSGPMVQAILDGRKTQTRRIIKPEWWRCLSSEDEDDRATAIQQCPYGKRGDRLWVRETFWTYPHPITDKLLREGADTWPRYKEGGLVYDADISNAERDEWRGRGWIRRPSIFMLRPYSRVTLEITGVRVERVRSITWQDAVAEGVAVSQGACIKSERYGGYLDASVYHYADLWDSLNAKRGFGWTTNPFVWVLEFKKVNE